MTLPAQFWLGLLTPHTPVGPGLDFSAIGDIGKMAQNAKLARAQREQQKHSDEIAQARLGLEQAKFQHQAQQDALARFGKTMDAMTPELATGAPNRAEAAYGAIRSAGGTVEPGVVGDPAQYAATLPEVPEMDLQMPDFAPAPAQGPRLATGLELEPLPGMADESPQSEYELQAPDVQAETFQAAPSTEHDVMNIYDPLGGLVQTYDQEGTYAGNIAAVEGALGTLASSYETETPVESDVLRNIATDAVKAVMGSPGGTQEKAIQYATKLFKDLHGERMKTERALIGASAMAGQESYNELSLARGFDRADKLMNRHNVYALQQTAEQLKQSVVELDRQIAAGDIDAGYVGAVMFSLARANEPGNPRLTNQDIEIAFPTGTIPERLKNALLKGLGGDIASWQDGISAFMGDTTVSEQTANRLLKLAMTRLEETMAKRARQRGIFEKEHQALVRDGMYGYARGFASAVNSAFPDLELNTPRPEQLLPSTLRSGDVRGQLDMQSRAPAPRKLNEPVDTNTNPDNEVVRTIQSALDSVTGAPAGQGYARAKQLLQNAAQLAPQKLHELMSLVQQFDAAQAFATVPDVRESLGVMDGVPPLPEDVAGGEMSDEEAEAAIREAEGY